MAREQALHHHIARAGLGLAAGVLLAVVTAAPALADPAAVGWSISPKSKTVTYGQGVLIKGVLKSGETPVNGLWVDFGQATTHAGSYEVVYKITTPAADLTGTYQIMIVPLKTMYYRLRWPGDTAYAAAESDVVPVQVAPALGAPANGTSITAGKKFSIKGSVEPGSPGGPGVKIKAYRQKGDGSWKGYKTYAAKVSGTQYAQSVAITQTGKFKFKAVSVAGAEFAAGESGFGRVLTVKQ
jgi:hypothetical protein